MKIKFNTDDDLPLSRNSLPEVSCKKGVIKNSTKLTGKYLCQSLFYLLLSW